MDEYAAQLPSVVLSKVAAMLQRRDGGYALKDRLRLSAVSRQLRQAVLSSIQQNNRRQMVIGIHDERIETNDVVVNKGLSSVYPEIEALWAFGQPNMLRLSYYTPLLNIVFPRILTSPLTHLDLQLTIEMLGVDSPCFKIMQAIGNMSNLEILKIRLDVTREYEADAHRSCSPSVPADSPFNQLLPLKNLRALRIDSPRLLSPTQMAVLLNRSSSNISHICCEDVNVCGNNTSFEEPLRSMNDATRANITGICCIPQRRRGDPWWFLVCLPNCAQICRWWWHDISRQKLDALGRRLLDRCCKDDARRRRRLECDFGCYNWNDLLQYLDAGKETEIEYVRDDTVVHFSIGSMLAMRRRHCPFSYNPYHYL